MSLETLVWINTVLLVFLAIRVHQLHHQAWSDAQEKAQREIDLDNIV